MTATEVSWLCFSERIGLLRRQHGLSKREMAKKLRISVASLEKIEKGELPPRLSARIVLCVYQEFGIPPHKQFDVIE